MLYFIAIGAKVAIKEIERHYKNRNLLPIVEITQQHPEKADVAEQGVEALWKLIRRDEKQLQPLWDSNFMETFQKILECHEKCEPVLLKCMGIIASIGKHGEILYMTLV